ncbi:hypothetical protein N7460_003148 [Penicillium canescens]|uniref:Initiation-specific alpha-1,6-mannosyltransferase n=1 Tax=Penicillium canescens TaxID=5083 RepID=A0AAD6IL43_PENCN|nr:hypothetical protein N7444_006132 [Penicillium canescens]KAJ6052614.1 hypothetical protein N7460_003148 [Penicillium canescens]
MGRFHYLLGVLLLFVTSSLWIALKLRADSPSLTFGYRECLCSDDAKVNNTSAEIKTIFLPQPSATNSQVKGTPLPEKSSYLPITNSYRHHKLSTSQPNYGRRPAPWESAQSERSNADQYVREQYADYPHILDLYLSLQVPILKADLLRQLILYADGGIWSDLDVTCHQPVDTWIPEKFKSKANVVVGLEFDGFQFSSWTVMSKPRTSHIVAVIKYVIKALEVSATQNNVTVADLSMEMISDVVDVTGPQAMTRALFQNLELEMGLPMGRDNITNITQPTLFQDVLVLPDAAFAAGQGGWPKNRGPYLVEHHYAGSWKNKDGGEQADADNQE